MRPAQMDVIMSSKTKFMSEEKTGASRLVILNINRLENRYKGEMAFASEIIISPYIRNPVPRAQIVRNRLGWNLGQVR